MNVNGGSYENREIEVKCVDRESRANGFSHSLKEKSWENLSY